MRVDSGSDKNEIQIDVGNVPSSDSLPAPELVNFYTFHKHRKLFIDFEIDDSTIEYEKFIINWNMEDKDKAPEEREPIWIYLMNYGGDAHLMFSMVDIIELSKTPVYTVNLGKCCSAAAIIFLAGHKRIMLPNSSVLLHQGSNEIQGDAGKVLDQAEAYKAMLDRMNKYIVKKTNISPRLLNKKRSSDWIIDAQFCLENGICDKIAETIEDII